jgi:hypothetical protein
VIVTAMLLMGFGLGAATTPATESILGSLPKEKAGVGSAVNDTTREIGGTLGVAVLGSLMASLYGGRILEALRGTPVPAGVRAAAGDSLAAALEIAGRVGGTLGADLAATAQSAFVHAFQIGSMVTGGVALLGAVIALLFLPSRVHDEGRDVIELPDRSEARDCVRRSPCPPAGETVTAASRIRDERLADGASAWRNRSGSMVSESPFGPSNGTSGGRSNAAWLRWIPSPGPGPRTPTCCVGDWSGPAASGAGDSIWRSGPVGGE